MLYIESSHRKARSKSIKVGTGFTEVHPIVVEPTLASPEDVAKTEAAAIATAEKFASAF